MLNQFPRFLPDPGIPGSGFFLLGKIRKKVLLF